MSDPILIHTSLEENKALFKSALPFGDSFDLLERDLTLADIPCWFVGINGLCDLDLILRIFSEVPLTNNQPPLSPSQLLPREVRDHFLYAQLSFSSSFEKLMDALLSGPGLLFFEGFAQACILDTRRYPSRSVEEPETEKVIRGSRDGFVETLLTNCNLIRRRLKTPRLTFRLQTVGKLAKNDVALAYVDNICDKELVEEIKNSLSRLNVSTLSMGVQSLRELLVKKSFFHPLPSFFLTARPDVACSYLAEGYVCLLVDNSPFALVLPATLFQFTQSPEDYYRSPPVGSWLRLVRLLCIAISLLLLPSFLYFASNPGLLPPVLSGLIPAGDSPLALFVYALFVELALDLFKYASSHSSNAYSGSFAIVGGLLIGDMAVGLEWANQEIIFYGAATLLASLGIVSVELSDAIRLYRLGLLLLTGFFPTWGFWAGLGLILWSVITTPVFGKKSYFWPLFPFRWKALKTLLFRRPTYEAQPERLPKQ